MNSYEKIVIDGTKKTYDKKAFKNLKDYSQKLRENTHASFLCRAEELKTCYKGTVKKRRKNNGTSKNKRGCAQPYHT